MDEESLNMHVGSPGKLLEWQNRRQTDDPYIRVMPAATAAKQAIKTGFTTYLRIFLFIPDPCAPADAIGIHHSFQDVLNTSLIAHSHE
jgi:hypothetical protein